MIIRVTINLSFGKLTSGGEEASDATLKSNRRHLAHLSHEVRQQPALLETLKVVVAIVGNAVDQIEGPRHVAPVLLTSSDEDHKQADDEVGH